MAGCTLGLLPTTISIAPDGPDPDSAFGVGPSITCLSTSRTRHLLPPSSSSSSSALLPTQSGLSSSKRMISFGWHRGSRTERGTYRVTWKKRVAKIIFFFLNGLVCNYLWSHDRPVAPEVDTVYDGHPLPPPVQAQEGVLRLPRLARQAEATRPEGGPAASPIQVTEDGGGHLGRGHVADVPVQDLHVVCTTVQRNLGFFSWEICILTLIALSCRPMAWRTHPTP